MLAGKFLAQRVQPRRVFQRAFLIVNGARPDDDEQARVFLPQDADDPFAAARDGGVHGVARRRLRLQFARREQPDDFFDVQVLRSIHEYTSYSSKFGVHGKPKRSGLDTAADFVYCGARSETYEQRIN